MSSERIDSINIPSGSVQWIGVYGSYLLVSNGTTIYKYNLSDYSLAGSFSVLDCGNHSYIDGDILWMNSGYYQIYKYDLTTELLVETYRVVLDNTGGGDPWTNAVMVTETAANNPPYDSSPWVHIQADNYAKTDFGHFVRNDGYALNITFDDALALGNVVSPNDYEEHGSYAGRGIMNSGEILFSEALEFRRYNDDTGALIGVIAMGGAEDPYDLFQSGKIYGSEGHIAESGDVAFSTDSFSIHTLGKTWEEDVPFGSPVADIGIFSIPPSVPPDTPTGLSTTCVKLTAPSITGVTMHPDSGEAPLNVDFSVSITGTPPFTYLWEFGDGNTSTDASPSHEYTDPGIYQVRLTVTNSMGEDTTIRGVVVDEIGIVLPPVSSFTVDVQSGLSPLAVVFTDISTGDPDTWEWYIDDVLQVSTQAFNHSFTADGTYVVKLVVKKDGVWESCATRTIIVSPDTAIPPIVTELSSTKTSSGLGTLTATFSSTVDGTPTSYLWDFGDGYSSDDESPTHTYTTSGIYTVTLTVTNAYGSTSAIMQIVVIQVTDIGVPGGDRYIGSQLIGYYIIDSGNHRILIYERTGIYITKFGELGITDGKFNFPTRLTVVGGVNLLDKVELE